MVQMLTANEIIYLTEKSYENRKKILKMVVGSPSHLGGAFSCLDIITVLYDKILKFNPSDPTWGSRDRFILSAGHKGIALYVTLQDKGFFEEELLWTYNKLGTRVGEHPNEKDLPGIEFPTGSLGHGLSAGGGMAAAGKIDKNDYRVFVLLGDGECAEGSVWEAAMAASHHKLDNLVAIVDRNNLQVNGRTFNVMNTGILEEKFRSFGWETRTINGHDFRQIYDSLKEVPFKNGRPSCIVADTIKCKGVTFKEDDFLSHHCHWDAEKTEEVLDLVEQNKQKELSSIE